MAVRAPSHKSQLVIRKFVNALPRHIHRRRGLPSPGWTTFTTLPASRDDRCRCPATFNSQLETCNSTAPHHPSHRPLRPPHRPRCRRHGEPLDEEPICNRQTQPEEQSFSLPPCHRLRLPITRRSLERDLSIPTYRCTKSQMIRNVLQEYPSAICQNAMEKPTEKKPQAHWDL